MFTVATLAVFALIVGGCATFLSALFGNEIDEATTVLHPDHTITYAEGLYQQARADADRKATSQRQVTQQQTQWVFSGAYDYEFNQGELKAGIAQGKYKLGRALGDAGVSSVYGGHSGGIYHEVLIPKTVNVTTTVTEVNEALWQRTYAESLKTRWDYIAKKINNDDSLPAGENAGFIRQQVMQRLEKRLRTKLPRGTHLLFGGYMGGKYSYEQENLLLAYIDDDGSFVCRWYK